MDTTTDKLDAASKHLEACRSKASAAGEQLGAFNKSQLYRAGYKPRPEREVELRAAYKAAGDDAHEANVAFKSAWADHCKAIAA